MAEGLTATFAPPTLGVVEHALRDLGYQDRFVGYAMTASAGNATKDIYSLKEAVLFLVGTRWDAPMLSPGFKGAFNWVDVEKLATWLREVVGDVDLAAAVSEQASGLESYKAQSEKVGELLNERMAQYRSVYDAAKAAISSVPADVIGPEAVQAAL